MAKQKYALNSGEKIVYKVSCVRHGFLGAYTHVLTITNQSVILEKYGMLNNFKEIERYDYSIINQAIRGKASNGEKQLKLYIGSKVEDFTLQSGNENELKVLVMAINDQMGPDAEYYDYNYYQGIITETKDADRILELRLKAQDEMPTAGGSGIEIASSAAKNLIKSGRENMVKSVDIGVYENIDRKKCTITQKIIKEKYIGKSPPSQHPVAFPNPHNLLWYP